MFTTVHGQFAGVDEFLENPALIQRTAGALNINNLPYTDYITQLPPFHVPTVLRARQLMVRPRFAYELRRALHVLPMAEATRQEFHR